MAPSKVDRSARILLLLLWLLRCGVTNEGHNIQHIDMKPRRRRRRRAEVPSKCILGPILKTLKLMI